MPGSADRPAGTGDGTGGAINDEVRAYIDATPAGHRPLFDRIHELILRAHPGVAVVWSYRMPTYQAGGRRIHPGVWKHGVSVYGWRQDDDGGFVARHPGLKTSTGTIRIRPDAAAAISDDEFPGLLRPALSSATT
jgi:hypothetical protein